MINPSLNGQLNVLYEYTKYLYQILIEIAENANKRARQYLFWTVYVRSNVSNVVMHRYTLVKLRETTCRRHLNSSNSAIYSNAYDVPVALKMKVAEVFGGETLLHCSWRDSYKCSYRVCMNCFVGWNRQAIPRITLVDD